MLNISVVLGSVREGRQSIYPAKFLVEAIKQVGHGSQLVDFKEMPLPFFNSEKLPIELKGKYENLNVQKWSDIAKAADAFVFVVPEYNHGYSAVLKNALDWLYLEFEKKPVGLAGVSGGSFAGCRAVEQLRPIIESFSGFAIREVLSFGKVREVFDGEGKLLVEAYNQRTQRFLESLIFFTKIMKSARNG